jgi:hypothetical protein
MQARHAPSELSTSDRSTLADFSGPCWWIVILFVQDAPKEFSEVDVLLREDGGRQVYSRKTFSRSRKCCPSCAGRFSNALFPGEIIDIPGFVKCSSRLKGALTPLVCALLLKGISVVLDFSGNTKVQRAWFRELIERANVEHELHFVDASDALRVSSVSEARGYLLALPGPGTRTLKPLLRIFSLPRRMKRSTSSVMNAPSRSET